MYKRMLQERPAPGPGSSFTRAPRLQKQRKHSFIAVVERKETMRLWGRFLLLWLLWLIYWSCRASTRAAAAAAVMMTIRLLLGSSARDRHRQAWLSSRQDLRLVHPIMRRAATRGNQFIPRNTEKSLHVNVINLKNVSKLNTFFVLGFCR